MTEFPSLSVSSLAVDASAAELRQRFSGLWLADEAELVRGLIQNPPMPAGQALLASHRAAEWVRRLRRSSAGRTALDAFMREYDLSSKEGVALMSLAEALLRIPDEDTADALIADKLATADWHQHLQHGDSFLLRASTLGLMLGSHLIRMPPARAESAAVALAGLRARLGAPLVRRALRRAMRLMGRQFVIGRDIGEALRNSALDRSQMTAYSFDMLGEAALCQADADRYLIAYRQAIEAIGAHRLRLGHAVSAPGISVKLSALHPRYEFAQRERVLAELSPRLLSLAELAAGYDIGLTIDAEEADRLELSLDVLLPVFRSPSLKAWQGFGLAVQAYQKRSLALIDYLRAEAMSAGRRLPIRLVKGAYWDSEIKRSQEQGLSSYPVFTHKAHTDAAYLACARALLQAREVFYPMFATHNAHTVAAISVIAGDEAGYEFQRLHGMGQALYRQVQQDFKLPLRIYAPVGSHEALLPYLVRRLLENGANTSFVNQLFDERIAPEDLTVDPSAQLLEPTGAALPPPADIYGAGRIAAAGLNLADAAVLEPLMQSLSQTTQACELVSLAVAGASSGAVQGIRDPADRRRLLGSWRAFEAPAIPAVIDAALEAQVGWAARPVEDRAQILDAAAQALEARREAFLYLLVHEAGKTITDAVSELREAVDFLRYYASEARRLLSMPTVLPGPTGEHNELQLHPRGVFACISPWNFPLAIFTGQLAAALVCGNAVIAKPAEQTNWIAVEMTRLLHGAGVPEAVLQLLLGAGDIGAAVCADERIAGVVFTGSLEVAQRINRQLAVRRGAIPVLIAETGGQNAMIVDSSALPEQVVKDVMSSAFLSAGQRCSALRVLYLQDEIAEAVIEMLKAALKERVIGDPALPSTDIGPVIDDEARSRLAAHVAGLRARGAVLLEMKLPDAAVHGSFFAPVIAALAGIGELEAEVFGPVLHVARFAAGDLDRVIDDINRSAYGLTLGVHSRIEATWRRVQARARVGNCYVNRGITGAVVGTQPFGGEARSGTGPKAGGPHYLMRFVTERVLSINTAAVGGNARLLGGAGL